VWIPLVDPANQLELQQQLPGNAWGFHHSSILFMLKCACSSTTKHHVHSSSQERSCKNWSASV